MKTLENYTPECIEPVIAEQYSELPKTIFEESKKLDDIKKVIHKHFVTTNERITVPRKLDATEISILRSNYPELLEIKLPKLKSEMLEITETAEATIKEAKRSIQEARDRVNACLTEMADVAHLVSVGTKDVTFELQQCYCFPVCGHHLYYAWVNERFALIRVTQINDRQSGELFTHGEQNMEAFEKHLSVNFATLLDERKAYAEQQAYEEMVMSELESCDDASEE